MKLTLKSVASVQLPAGKIDHVEFDDDVAGFGLRLREGGTRTWIYRYRIGKKQYSITLGSATAVPLAVARANAGALEAKIRLGGNPALERRTARIEASNTVGALVDEYLDARKNEWRHGTARQVRQHLLRHARSLHGLPIATLTLRDVAKVLNTVASNAGGATTNRVRSTLEAFLGWAIRQGHSPPQGNVASLAERRAETPRDRMLNDAEIATVWNACRDDDYGAIIRLLILTGQREGEIGSLRWDEVKDDRIELPGGRTKNGRAHVIPLSVSAKTIIDKFRMAGRTFVFGRDDRNGFKGWGPAKTKLLERIAQAETAMTPWVVHDLRRSAASGMQRLGIRVEVIERVLNHVSGSFRGVAGVYQRDPMSADVRDALDRWAWHIASVVEGRGDATVVPMKRA